MAQSTGVTAISTTDNNAVAVFTVPSVLSSSVIGVRVVNTTANAGFFSLDGGTTWRYLPASTTVTIQSITGVNAIQIKRITGGSDITVHVDVWPTR